MTLAIHIKSGTVVFRAGEPGDVAYFVESGRLQIQTHHRPDALILGHRGVGQLVGEMALIDGGARSAAVIAVEDCVLQPISQDQISTRMKAADPVVRACLETILTRFRATLQTLSDLKPDQSAPYGPGPDADVPAEALRLAADSLKLETEIRDGLARNEFLVHYQPIIALATGDLHGFEALIRWNHPRLGRLGPQHFIPVAESADLMPLVTHWMMDAALAGLVAIDHGLGLPHDADRAPRLSVNISTADLAEGHRLVPHLSDCLTRHGIPPRRVTVEVTETALMTNSAQAIAQLKLLRDLGCGVAIDDFGTGYANLSYVQTLPATSLKLDRSFTAAMAEDALTRKLVRSVLTLAEDLGLSVVAEGLELPDDMALLHRLGCPYGQGFGIARPTDQIGVTDWALRWQLGDRTAPFAASVRARTEYTEQDSLVPAV